MNVVHNNYIQIYVINSAGETYAILPKVLAPLLMKGLTALVISMSTNIYV